MATRRDLQSLTEGQRLDDVELTRAEAVALNATKLVSVTPSVRGWQVTAAYAVGALRCGDLQVRVQPKVGSIQVVRLLARAHGARQMNLDELAIGLAEDRDLTSVMAVLFAAEAALAMAPGPLWGYRTEDHVLPVLRGRLRIRDQELRRFGQIAPIEVTLDEWTTDTDDNRRLRAATQRLLIVSDLPELTRQRLIRLDRQLADVTPIPIGAPVPAWTRTRLNARLHALLALADLVISYGAIEHRVGEVTVKGFVLSMPALFEKLITRLLIEAARAHAVVRPQRSYGLDADHQLTIRPDLIFTRDRVDIGVADLKYKLLNEDGAFPNPDAYQLITYCTRLGLTTGHLIYVADDPSPALVRVIGSDVNIQIHAVDLAQPVEHLEHQVLDILIKITRPDS